MRAVRSAALLLARASAGAARMATATLITTAAKTRVVASIQNRDAVRNAKAKVGLTGARTADGT